VPARSQEVVVAARIRRHAGIAAGRRLGDGAGLEPGNPWVALPAVYPVVDMEIINAPV